MRIKSFSYKVTDLAVGREIVTAALTSLGYQVTWKGDNGTASKGGRRFGMLSASHEPYSELGLVLTYAPGPAVRLEQRRDEDLNPVTEAVFTAIVTAGLSPVGTSEMVNDSSGAELAGSGVSKEIVEHSRGPLSADLL
jgi:hypothetical protein